jgi:hypothetical protein
MLLLLLLLLILLLLFSLLRPATLRPLLLLLLLLLFTLLRPATLRPLLLLLLLFTLLRPATLRPLLSPLLRALIFIASCALLKEKRGVCLDTVVGGGVYVSFGQLKSYVLLCTCSLEVDLSE